MAEIPVTPNPEPTPATIPVEVVVWYKSVTLWTNVITTSVLILNQVFGYQIDPKLQAGILAIVNVVLQAPKMAVTQSRATAHNKAVREKLFR